MISLLLTILFAQQVEFEAQPKILLEKTGLDFERMSVSADRLFVPDEGNSAVLVFDKSGKQLAMLQAASGAKLQLPHQVTWVEADQRVYVYDSAVRQFFVWDANFQPVNRMATNFDVLFEVGRLIQVGGGFAAPVSLVKEKFLVGRFDAQFQPIRYGYEIMNRQLTKMSPVLRRSFLARVKSQGGERLLVMQSLSPSVAVFDTNLSATNTFTLSPRGWTDANMRKLKKVSKNPRELQKLQETFSEVVSLFAVGEDMFLVGFRNIRSRSLISYQCYNAETGQPQGISFDTAFRLVAVHGDTGYYQDPASSKPELYPIRVVRR
ncbi:hypothetical protein SCOR_13940 [Sulfidibacter corallicola]|uniref:6-bladed beta-propeller protein n=1 Tax=Sulfidibacter corallicola TaxID=2818388 RepID=A0A8A4TFP9_SULCO|nr:hypothetical protein [Sulfidibacter corallicola]QTD47581.1 hypothetical protein J3U87_18470 [Sulfidibacter corallicola]